MTFSSSAILSLLPCYDFCFFLFFFNDTATTEIYTLSLHDALPISDSAPLKSAPEPTRRVLPHVPTSRSEEHTSELQSLRHLVCRLLLEKKKTKQKTTSDEDRQHREEVSRTNYIVRYIR